MNIVYDGWAFRTSGTDRINVGDRLNDSARPLIVSA